MKNPGKQFCSTSVHLMLGATLFFGGCVGLIDTASQRLRTPDSPSTTLSRHHGHSDVIPSHLHSAIADNACESAGIQGIINLMRQSRFEVMRVYIPDEESPLECQWVEIGKGIYGGGVEEATVAVDRKSLSRLMKEHATLHLYHFHPLVYFEKCRGEKNCGEISVPMSSAQLSGDGLMSNLRYSMPSPSDIAFMMDVSREFDKHHRGGGKIRHRVVAPYGIVDYSLTAEGKQRLEDDGLEGEKGRYGFDTYVRTRMSYVLSDIDAIVGEDAADMRRVLKRLARRLSNEYLRVLFTPFEDEKH